ncbi:MAG: hypothetical protein A3F74_17000 [Betaproteobacteria bacterium RIFCSPLOWO2_12_FULL_62_58]|nr:MAG: hypothetical protein A3F74_17000 [Betaproteobacteria bacterium RIFCSPLOWO2_12_FULL_62_58]
MIYLPFCSRIFKLLPLTPAELAICIAISAIVFAMGEIEKWLVRRRRFYRGSVTGGSQRARRI